MTSSKKMLDALFFTVKSLPQHPVTKLAERQATPVFGDEANTVLHILAVREEIERTRDDKYLEDCQVLLAELEIHLKELQRKSDIKWLSYSPIEELITRDCDRMISNLRMRK